MALFAGAAPNIQVLVRDHYLFNLERGFDTYTEARVVGLQMIQGRAIGFNVLLANGALYWGLPVSALTMKEHQGHYLLNELEAWDAFGYQFSVVQYPLLKNMMAVPFKLSQRFARYLFTIEFGAPTTEMIDTTWSEDLEQRKCLHVLAMECGCLIVQPNNRLRFADKSWIESHKDLPHYEILNQLFTSET